MSARDVVMTMSGDEVTYSQVAEPPRVVAMTAMPDSSQRNATLYAVREDGACFCLMRKVKSLAESNGNGYVDYWQSVIPVPGTAAAFAKEAKRAAKDADRAASIRGGTEP